MNTVMQLDQLRNFRIWNFSISHRQLRIRSTGARFPTPVQQIEINFRAVVRLDLDSEFVADSVEEGSTIHMSRRAVFLSNFGKERTYIFRAEGVEVGRVNAIHFEMVTSDLKPLESKRKL